MVFEASTAIKEFLKKTGVEKKGEYIYRIMDYIIKNGLEADVYFKKEVMVVECFDTFAYAKMRGILPVLEDVVKRDGFSLKLRFKGNG